jgi:putative aldouronate transport system permease protein
MVTYMPYFISTVLVVSILEQMLSLTGPINNMIAASGADKIHFLGDPKLFQTLYVFSGVWQGTGYNAVIYLSALAAVDTEMHEAAIVDGASIWKRILHIDLPSIAPTFVILLIMACGKVLSVGYEKVLLLQNDMNMTKSDIISTYVYRVGLNGMQYSYSTAIGLFQSVVSLLMLLLVNWISRRVGETSLF